MVKKKVAVRTKRGFALTVFRSPKITRFGIELLGNMPEGGVAGTDLLVARAFGPDIDALGGVPFGASGSPVYISDTLIGAVSMVLSSDFKHIGITPISDIIALQHEPLAKSTNFLGRTAGAASNALPVGGGFRSSKAAEQIKKRFGKESYVAPPRVVTGKSTGLKSGSPVGMALLTGDLKIGFIGTTTLVEQSRVFAFGHPLLFAGPISLPLTEAFILATGGGPYPAKIGVIGDTIGTVLQDRAAGIFGLLSSPPNNLVKLNLVVRDGDRIVTEHIQAQAVPIPAELPFLAFIAALETVVRAMNRVGSGYGSWTWRVSFVEGDPLEVDSNLFDPFDIAFTIAASIFPLMEEALEEMSLITAIELNANVRMK